MRTTTWPASGTLLGLLRVLGDTQFAFCPLPRLNEDVWDYRSLHGTTFIYITEIHFDGQGRVKYFVQYPDPAYHNRRR